MGVRVVIRADSLSSSLGPAFRAASSAADLRQNGVGGGERFSDFSAFQADAGGQVGLGGGRASIDAGHAARSVAAYLMED